MGFILIKAMEKTKRHLIFQVKFFGQGVLSLQDNSKLTMWVSKPESGDYFHLNTTFYGLAAKGSKALIQFVLVMGHGHLG